ncbi:MAG: TIGR03792 family protein [Calothrix sp. C42_A2020_038]|nr:TIGR03792 family protein [Calothrix sp. C42_A2020_038]
MVIELLRFKVPSQRREIFIQKDDEIWTAALAKYPGFLGKEVWINPNAPEEVTLVIKWATREQWKAIPNKDLDTISQQFDRALGFSSQMIESSEYQVRKFPQV